jgi:hypothetical protein
VQVRALRIAAHPASPGPVAEIWIFPQPQDTTFSARLDSLLPGTYTVTVELHGLYEPPDGSHPDSGLVFFGSRDRVRVLADEMTSVSITLAPFVPLWHPPQVLGDTLRLAWTPVAAAEEYEILRVGDPPGYFATTDTQLVLFWREVGKSQRVPFRVRARNAYATGAYSDTVGAPPPRPPAFTVAGIAPAAGDTISLTEPLVIRFTRPVDPTSLVAGRSVVVTAPPETVALGEIQREADPRVITIPPLAEWRIGLQHEVLLTPEVTDTSGTPLDGNTDTPEPDPFESVFFVRRPPNRPPEVPLPVYPPDSARDVGPLVTFRWHPATDPDDDPVLYDLRAGALDDPDPPAVRTNLQDTTATVSFSQWEPGSGVVWWVEAHDPFGGRTASQPLVFFLLELPAAPAELVVVARTDTSITLSWQDRSDNEAGFQVDRKGEGVPTFLPVGGTGPDTTTFVDAPLSPRTRWSYRVRAWNAAGESAPSDTVEAWTRPIPPSNLQAIWISPQVAHVTWTYEDAAPDAFVVERSTDGGAFQRVGSPQGDTWEWWDEDVAPGHEYFYRMRAVLWVPQDTSRASESVPLLTPVPSPEGLSATATSPTLVELSWSYPGDPPDSFLVERRDLPDSSFTRIAGVPGSTLGLSDPSVRPGRGYGYRVSALSGGILSFPSDEALVTTPISPPSFVSADALGPDRIQVVWAYTDPDPLGFLLERKAPGESGFSLHAVLEGGSRSFEDSLLAPESTYAYRLRSYDLADTSEPSVEVQATTTSAAPSPPRNLVATAETYEAIHLAWDAPLEGPVDSFRVERRGEFESLWSIVATVAGDTLEARDDARPWRSLWFYRIRAINVYGVSEPSNTDSARVLLPPPTDLAAEATGPDVIALGWNYQEPPGGMPYQEPDRFVIERMAEGELGFSYLDEVPGSVTGYADYPLQPETVYSYRVRAEDAYGVSAWSPVATDTTGAEPPGTPQDVVLEVLGPYELRLSWAPGPGGAVDTFEIARQRLQDPDLLAFQEVPGTETQITVGAAPARRYRFAVRARNAGGTSEWSQVVEGWTPGWRRLGTVGSPPPRTEMAGALDDPSRMLVVFGGSDDELVRGQPLGDLWGFTLEDTTWTELGPVAQGPAPPAVKAMGFAHDWAGRRLYILGGEGGMDYAGVRLWFLELSTLTWDSLHAENAPPPPEPRVDFILVHRPNPQAWVTHGGWMTGFDGQYGPGLEVLSPTQQGYIWESWSSGAGDPAPLAGHVGLYNPARDELVVFGGERGFAPGDSLPRDGLFTRSLSSPDASWIQRAQAGDLPGPRTQACAVFDEEGQRLFLFGGFDGVGYRNDLYTCVVNPDSVGAFTWTRLGDDLLPQDQPEARSGALLVWDDAGHQLVLFGGWDGTGVRNDVWVYRLP